MLVFFKKKQVGIKFTPIFKIKIWVLQHHRPVLYEVWKVKNTQNIHPYWDFEF
jgi:hypothetical protein